jgi:hypothetical protein
MIWKLLHTAGRPWPEDAPLEAVAQDMVACGHMVAESVSEAPALREEWATMEPALSSGCRIRTSVLQNFLMHSAPVCVWLQTARNRRQAQQHGAVNYIWPDAALQAVWWPQPAVLT